MCDAQTGEGGQFSVATDLEGNLTVFKELTGVSSKDLLALLIARLEETCLGVLPAAVTHWHIVSGSFCSPFCIV